MITTNILIFLLVILITNGIQAITGFAGTLLAMPPAILLIGVNDAKVVLNLITLITCIVIAYSNKKDINYKVLKKVIIYMGIGMCLGIIIYKIVNIDFLLDIYGIMIILLALKNLFYKKQINYSNILIVILLITAGIIHGMFISGGALLVVYMAHELKNKNEFRATMATVWVLLNSLIAITQIYSRQINENLIILTLIALIPAVLGVFVGNKLHERISKELFMKLTYILLLISGLVIFI